MSSAAARPDLVEPAGPAPAPAVGPARAGREVPAAVVRAVEAIRDAGVAAVRRYTRLEVTGTDRRVTEPTLFVANHGFGGLFDLNNAAILAALAELRLDRPVTVLAHQLTWTLGVGPLLEPIGLRPAARASADAAFAEGHHVLVLPGGDVEAGRPFRRRDEIVHDGRRGFARVAADHGVPIVPVVTAGAGESLYVFSDGVRLARLLRVDRLLRVKALPVSLSLPWGLSVGVVGIVPYLPLPTKLRTAVLDPMTRDPGEAPEAFGDRVQRAMQAALTDLTAGRRWLIG
jgi:1-acyl-sn-glycerol-3-phosphate acyltransferase